MEKSSAVTSGFSFSVYVDFYIKFADILTIIAEFKNIVIRLCFVTNIRIRL